MKSGSLQKRLFELVRKIKKRKVKNVSKNRKKRSKK